MKPGFIERRLPAVCIAGAVWLCGCQAARMAVDPALAGAAPEMPVRGRQGFGFNKPLSFGDFRVTDIHRGWLQRTKWDILGFTSEKARQSYEFKVSSEGGSPWQAQCATGLKRKDLELDNFLGIGGSLEVELETDVLFACTFAAPGGGEWKMVLAQGTCEAVMNGLLTDSSKQVVVEGTPQLAGSTWPLMDPTGYHFLLNGRIVGAVEVLNEGAVWIAPSLDKDTRMALAAASSALLLYRDLEDR